HERAQVRAVPSLVQSDPPGHRPLRGSPLTEARLYLTSELNPGAGHDCRQPLSEDYQQANPSQDRVRGRRLPCLPRHQPAGPGPRPDRPQASDRDRGRPDRGRRADGRPPAPGGGAAREAVRFETGVSTGDELQGARRADGPAPAPAPARRPGIRLAAGVSPYSNPHAPRAEGAGTPRRMQTSPGTTSVRTRSVRTTLAVTWTVTAT